MRIRGAFALPYVVILGCCVYGLKLQKFILGVFLYLCIFGWWWCPRAAVGANAHSLDVCGYFCQREPGPPKHPKGVQQELGCGWNGLASAQGFAGAQWHMWPLPHPPAVCDSGLPCPVLATFAQSTWVYR